METARSSAKEWLDWLHMNESYPEQQIDSLAKHIQQFAEAQVREETQRNRVILDKYIDRAYAQGFAECRELCAKIAEEMKNHAMNCDLLTQLDEQCSCEAGPIADKLRALTPDGKETPA